MSKPTYYITTPIYYPSGKLHIGNAYTTVVCDAMARYKRMRGFDVFYLTGSDEHGQKIETKALAAGVSPKEYVDTIVADIKELWDVLNISYDKYIRTTDDYHEAAVQKIFKALYDKGEIYKGEYSGKYCKDCEAFWTETQLKDGNCPDCGRAVEDAKEEAYFFRLSKYADRLIELYDNHPEFIQPPSRKAEMVNNFIKPGLEDLCVSRTSFTWGVPVDFDPSHVVYVWVDALSNYITALGYESDDETLFQKFWPADLHMVGKEIVRFHTIIWPAMLMALDLPLPKRVFGHGWITGKNGDKIGKSRGNGGDPIAYCKLFSVDAIRYFLLREMPFGSDGIFSNEALISRVNSDLANDLGNLVSRTSAMASKYFPSGDGGQLAAAQTAGEFDDELIKLAKETVFEVEASIEKLEFSVALTALWKLVSRTNKYIDETAPWVLAKEEINSPRLARVLYNLCESIRIITVMITPFMPETAEKIKAVLSIKTKLNWDDARTFGLLPTDVIVAPTLPIFPRLDAGAMLVELEKLTPASETVKAETENIVTLSEIGIDDFFKIELRVCKVLVCEPIKKAKKLLKLTLDDGSGTPRTVASGIALHYTPEQLTGRNVVVVANLKPAMLCGVESAGMILAADVGESVKVLFVDDLPVGSKLR